MTPQVKGKVDKGWGYEIVWANNTRYSGKLLVFERQGAKTSLLFHKEHTKTWFVNSGKFKITFIDTLTGEIKESIVEEGKTIDIIELSPHRVELLTTNGIIFEVGTTDFVEDRFRLAPGDTQRFLAAQTPADPS